jgi:hypothetical protein
VDSNHHGEISPQGPQPYSEDVDASAGVQIVHIVQKLDAPDASDDLDVLKVFSRTCRDRATLMCGGLRGGGQGAPQNAERQRPIGFIRRFPDGPYRRFLRGTGFLAGYRCGFHPEGYGGLMT